MQAVVPLIFRDWSTMNTPDSKARRYSVFSKIVATIGPASDTPEQVRRLIEAGVSVFRFNFSHGDFEAHAARLKVVRGVAAEMGIQIACLGDLQGPKIRVGKVPAGVGEQAPSGGGLIRVASGQDVILKRGIEESFIRRTGTAEEVVLSVTYERLIDEVEPGHKVLINDGAIRMLALSRDAEAGELRCRVVVGGAISSKKGINVPQSDLSAPAVTERDWEWVKWAVAQRLDFLALSFVRNSADVIALRNGIAACEPAGGSGEAPWIPIVSKIEMPQAVADLSAIVEHSDVVMVARGDLGVEMDIARVPVVQKQIIRVCNDFGKPCIVATQMLETMIESAVPTRAEASDVANAIFDGADAVMLSAETATGKHPVLVVETMTRIINVAEERIRETLKPSSPPLRTVAGHRATAALAHGAWEIARDLCAKAVVCWSQNGGTARYLSQNSFDVPIFAFTSDPVSARRMALYKGVTAVVSEPPASGKLSDWNEQTERLLVDLGAVTAGDFLVLLAGRPLGRAKATNTIAIHRVGEAVRGFRDA